MRYPILVLGITLAGCGGDDDAPTDCAPTDRAGTYLDHFVTKSGNCGDIPDSISRAGDPTTLPDGCTLDGPDVWSHGECKLERAYTCDEPGLGAGFTAQTVAVTTQQTSDASRITGTATLRVFGPDQTQRCVGTYELTFTRQ